MWNYPIDNLQPFAFLDLPNKLIREVHPTNPGIDLMQNLTIITCSNVNEELRKWDLGNFVYLEGGKFILMKEVDCSDTRDALEPVFIKGGYYENWVEIYNLTN